MSKQVISFHYTLTNGEGKVLDSSNGREPLAFLEGTGQIIEGLESEILKMKVGDKAQIPVPYQKAYGEYNQQLIYEVTKDKFPDGNLKLGDIFQLNNGDMTQLVTVVDLKDNAVTLDANHPLAGVDLNFAIEITEIREATNEELAHGHVHGKGGHHHH